MRLQSECYRPAPVLQVLLSLHCGPAAQGFFAMSLLPSCPSCGQSVLDDDAAECPFCGASMKGGKPGAKPAAPAAKAAAKKAEPKKPAASTDDDNPFGTTAPMSARKAILLLAKPGKGKLHRIVCPMCDTPGFWSKDAVGQDVRCANSQCPMPFFNAPVPEGEEAPVSATKPAPAKAASVATTPAQPAKKKSMVIPLSIGIVALGGGLLAWSQFSGGKSKEEANRLNQAWTPPTNTSSNNPEASNGTDTTNPAADPNTGTTSADPKTKTVALPSNDELRAEGLKRIVEFAADPDRNKRKDQCRRLTAEAMALLSDLNAVNAQLKQFDVVGGDQIKYYHSGPLALAAWTRLGANDAAQAKVIIEQAAPFVAQLPPTGGYPLETAIEVASLYQTLDRSADAVALMATRKNEPELDAQVDAYLRAERTGRFNLDEVAATRSIASRSVPATTVAFNLVLRGHADKALAWAKAAGDPPAVADALAAVAEGLVATGGALDAVSTEINTLAPGFKARALARLAIAQQSAGKADLAKAAAAQAAEAANAVSHVTSPEMPDMKGIYNLQAADMTARVEDALSIAEVAHAQALVGDRDAVWTTLTKAVNVARATAPQAALAEAPLNEINTIGNAAVTNKLKALLKLKGDDEARPAFNQYRRNAKVLADASANRLTLVSQLFEAACDWGFVDQVWTEVQTRGTSKEPGTAEPWFDSLVPSICEAHYRAAGEADKAAAIEAAVGAERLKEKRALRTHFRLAAFKTAETGTPQVATQVANVLKDFTKIAKAGGDKPWQEEILGRIASQWVTKGQTASAFALAGAIDDPFTRDTIFEFVASQATRKGEIQLVRDYAFNRQVPPPDRVAVLRGWLVNLPK